jgi:RHS repeat-associated protein
MAHYFYNGDGLRVQSRVGIPPNNIPTNYVWDVGAGLPVILQETKGANTTYYVYGLDLISSVSGTAATYYLNDGLGSTTALADGSGIVTDSYKYDVFGAERSHTGPGTLSDQPFKFTGEQNDATVNGSLYYLRARMYDPSLGRFWSRDPLDFVQRYAYVGNNPGNFVDPYGLLGWNDVKKAAGGAVDYVVDKTQDAVSLAAHCGPGGGLIRRTCTSDLFAFGISLTCHGDRQSGPGGWAYYENARGGCEFMWKVFPDAACYTPGYLAFCKNEPDPGLQCHEYQHYIQSRLIPFPFYWAVATTPFVGERDADAAQNDKESRVPFTPIPWPIQCR